MAEPGSEPWLKQRRWRAGRIVDGTPAAAATMWAFAVLFAAASAALAWAVIKRPALRHDFPILLAIAFPIVTLILLLQALQKTIQWMRFGRSVLELATFPGVIGCQLVGVVYTQVKLQATDGFDVALSCIERVISGHGNNQSVHDIVIWHEEQHLVRGAMEQDMTRSAIPVGFRIPRGCKPTFHATGYTQVIWKLRVRAKVPGVDYEANFEVPVFVTADSAAGLDAAVDPVAPYRAPTVKQTGPTEKGVAFWKDAAGTVHIRYRAGRNLRETWIWCFFTAITVGATYFLWTQPRHGAFDHLVLETMTAGFAFVSLLLLMICFLLLFQNMEVAADDRQVVVTTRYWFVWRFVRRVESKDVHDIQMAVNQTSGVKSWYAVNLRVPWKKADTSVSERNICVGSGIEKADAEWLIKQLREVVMKNAKN